MRNLLLEKFKVLYPKSRLLAIQLNGFSHKVFYDKGKNTPIQVEEYSAYTGCDRVTSNTIALLGNIAHYNFKGNPKEIVYVKPDER